MSRHSVVWLAFAAVVTAPAVGWTQAPPRPPRLFSEFVGTWVRDPGAGEGHIAGLPVARTITIATTPTEISVVKDSAPAEIYKTDGSETPLRDERTGVTLQRTTRFTLVAEMLALTTTQTRPSGGGPLGGNQFFTNIITDAYGVAGDVLTIERQLSVLLQPPGHLVTLSEPRNNRQTLVYRRTP